MKFEVKNRFTKAVKFTAEIDCAEDEPMSVKLGLAARWAIDCGADLTDASLFRANLFRANLFRANLFRANLTDANLTDADLSRANLSRANLNGANLNGANLNGASLNGANLNGASLIDANLIGVSGVADRVIDGGLRSDGYRFMLTRTEPGEWRVKAGCRNFEMAEAHRHWFSGHPRQAETWLIIDYMVAMAKLRGWPANGEEHKRED